MSNTEHWKLVPEFPDYEVSNHGRIRSWRQATDGRKNHRKHPHYFKPFITRFGYAQVMLRKKNSPKPHRCLVHRLVALAFIPNPKGLSDVAHNDGSKNHNHVNNLRWSTHRENQMDMRQHGTMQDGERCCTAKLTEAQVLYIKDMCKKGKRGTQRKMARQFGISPAQVNRIVKGTRWRYLQEVAA